MQSNRIFYSLVFALGISTCVLPANSDPDPIKPSSEILKMLSTEVSEEVIIQWLESGHHAGERVGPETVIALKNAGASDQLLKRILKLVVPTENAAAEPAEGSSDSAVRGLIEPISAREREILALIAEGSTNNTISATLFISQNTVKWHLKNIFGKLGVSNRTSAVAVARQLSLLA